MTALLSPHVCSSHEFAATVDPLTDAETIAMRGKGFSDDGRCPTQAMLAVVRFCHWQFTGGFAHGSLVVNRAIAQRTVALLRRLWTIGFPLHSAQPIEVFDGDDDRSMAANNSSAFNFRTIAGTDTLSQHAFGLAIDLNPVQNPWVVGARILPASGESYLDRSKLRLGMIVRPGPVVAAFDELGWEWGGDWRHASDYHHIVAK